MPPSHRPLLTLENLKRPPNHSPRPHSCLPTQFFHFNFHHMHSHELLRDVLHKGNAKEIASAMNLSLSLIYKWAEPCETNGSGAVNPLDRIESLVHSTSDLRIVQWICERAGGFFIKNPKSIWPHPHFLIPATNQVVQEFADLLAVIATAASDNAISKTESKEIRARWEELKCATEGFVRCCEEGNFAPLKKIDPGH